MQDVTGGFSADDHVVSVDGADVVSMEYSAVMDLIVGSGEKVTFVLASSSDVDAFFANPDAVPEASINDLLRVTAPGFAIGEDTSITSYLKTAADNDPTAKAIRSKLYDVTVPFTTRSMRPGEVDGTHYNFITVEVFKRYIAADALIEYGEHNGNFYGTMKVAAAESAALQSRPGLVATKVEEATIAGLFDFLLQ